MFDFQIQARCPNTAARVASFSTPHGNLTTPQFMPVGTLGTVKGITATQLKEVNAQMILANTYHLHLQPGENVIQGSGGIHKFMNWEGPILTDSGGYQVFSLSKLNKIDDQGVSFKNPRDGSNIELTPEKSIQIQVKVHTVYKK